MMSGADPIDSVVDLDRPPSSRPFVLALHECDEDSRPIVGTKAFKLARFSRADFPVPPGVVVASEAFSRWLALLGEPLDAERAAHSPVPSDVEQAVLEAVRTLGDGPVEGHYGPVALRQTVDLEHRVPDLSRCPSSVHEQLTTWGTRAQRRWSLDAWDRRLLPARRSTAGARPDRHEGERQGCRQPGPEPRKAPGPAGTLTAALRTLPSRAPGSSDRPP